MHSYVCWDPCKQTLSVWHTVILDFGTNLAPPQNKLNKMSQKFGLGKLLMSEKEENQIFLEILKIS